LNRYKILTIGYHFGGITRVVSERYHADEQKGRILNYT